MYMIIYIFIKFKLKSNTKFLENICFDKGVLVKQHVIKLTEDLEQIFSLNLFNDSIKTFYTVQQISPEDLGKYFILGIKFLLLDYHLRIFQFLLLMHNQVVHHLDQKMPSVHHYHPC